MTTRSPKTVAFIGTGVMGAPTNACIAWFRRRAVMRGSRTVRSRGCTRPANWKKPGLRPQKCIGTTVAPVLRASEAIIGFHGGSRTRRLLRSTLETSPDGNTPRM